MNEFDIINKIIKRNSDSAIGDDCSVAKLDDQNLLVTTADLLVENIHFRLSTTSFKDLGYKTLAVNVSDVAAMAARPLWAHLSIAAPSTMTEKQMDMFFDGLYELADELDIQLMGGDLSASSSDLFISLTLSGKVHKDKIKRRSSFRPGDELFVTGTLGDSAAGLRLLEEKQEYKSLTQRHLRPPIHLSQALQLGENTLVHGMMDVSDGLLSDLERVSELTGCGFEINLELLPFSRDFKEICQKKNWDPLELALAGGEDYCLLFSAEQGFKMDGAYSIGCVTENDIIYQKDGEKVGMPFKAFSHF